MSRLAELGVERDFVEDSFDIEVSWTDAIVLL